MIKALNLKRNAKGTNLKLKNLLTSKTQMAAEIHQQKLIMNSLRSITKKLQLQLHLLQSSERIRVQHLTLSNSSLSSFDWKSIIDEEITKV